MKRYVIVITLIILILPVLLEAQEKIELSLDEALVIALRGNRGLLLKKEDVRKAQYKIREAEADLFPALDFTGSWKYTQGLYQKSVGQYSTQTTLKQYLYTGGEIINTIKYNGYDFEVKQAIFDQEKLELALDVQEAFYTMFLAQELAKLNRGILENTSAHLKSVEERFQKGEASESDVLKMEASLKGIEQVLESSFSQVEAAQALLRNLLYLDEDVEIDLSGRMDYEERQVAFEEAFLQAVRRRPEIRQYEADINAKEKAIDIAKADSRPSIYASWDYYSASRKAATVNSISKNWNDHNILGLTFSWPIFDGWQTKAKVEQAMADLKKSRLLKEQAISDIALELQEAYLALKDAISRIKAVESEAIVYLDNLLGVKERYKQGAASSLDLDDAKLKYDTACFNKKEAAYDYIIAGSVFDKAAGG